MTTSYLKLTGTLHALGSLHMGTGRRTGVIKHSYPYIPGSFIRGSMGTALVKLLCQQDEPLADHEQCSHYADCSYAKLYGEGRKQSSNIFFRYAYPVHLKCGGVYRPAPRTLYICENSQCGETVDTFSPPTVCPVCGGKLRPYQGYRCDGCGELERRPIKLTRFTSTAIDRGNVSAASVQSASGESGTLHTIEVVPRGSRFRFEAILSPKCEGQAEALLSVLEKGLPDEGLGGSRSRGFGHIGVDDASVQEVSIDDVKRRADEIDSASFTVETHSPLLIGGALKAGTLLEGARRAYSWAFHEGKPMLPEFSMETSRVGVENFGGWSQRTGSRRRLMQGLSVGSMFKLRCDEPSDEVAKALAALEVYPLGDYKPHGCGQLKIGAIPKQG